MAIRCARKNHGRPFSTWRCRPSGSIQLEEGRPYYWHPRPASRAPWPPPGCRNSERARDLPLPDLPRRWHKDFDASPYVSPSNPGTSPAARKEAPRKGTEDPQSEELSCCCEPPSAVGQLRAGVPKLAKRRYRIQTRQYHSPPLLLLVVFHR